MAHPDDPWDRSDLSGPADVSALADRADHIGSGESHERGPIVLERPRPGRSWAGRVGDLARPWAEWFGFRRVVGAALTIVAVVAGGWWLLQPPAPPTEAALPFATTTTAPGDVARPDSGGSAPPSNSRPGGVSGPPATVPATVVVDVAGAVLRPGVYELPGGARAHAAVEAAGGPSPEADLSAVNLAAPLVDGSQVYVPVVGAPARAGPPPGPSPPSAPAGPVDIDRATADQLDALPGIGPSTAAAIVAHREENGPFASVDQLQDVRGIGPAKLDAIRELVTL